MDNYITGYLIFNMVYSTLFVLLVCGNEAYMIPWWITLISAIVPALITAFVSIKISSRSQIQKNSDKIDTMIELLGNRDKDRKSLSGQHDDITMLVNNSSTVINSAIEKETKAVEQRYEEDERRYKMFTAEQHNTAEQIEQFKLFMEDWKRLAARVSSMQYKIDRLEEENKELRAAVITQQPDQGRK